MQTPPDLTPRQEWETPWVERVFNRVVAAFAFAAYILFLHVDAWHNDLLRLYNTSEEGSQKESCGHRLRTPLLKSAPSESP